MVCFLGPRQPGKITLVRQLVPQIPYISFDDQNLLEAAKSDPVGFVQGSSELVIYDEIQRVPELMLI